MTPSKSPKKWLFFVPLLIGLAILVVLAKRGGELQRSLAEPPARNVRFVEAPLLTEVPRALGYGQVRPERDWEAVAEVSGRIVELNPAVKKGAMLEADSLLLRVDPADYALALARADADILATEAKLEELKIRESNTRSALEIETKALGLRESELDRKRELVRKGTVSVSDFEQEERNLLGQRQQVQTQRNALNLLPAERSLLQAQLDSYQAQRERARLDLARTEIRLPFRARISEVAVETTQYVRQGNVLIKADGIDKAEIEAQIPIARMRALLHGEPQLDMNTETTADLSRRLGIRARVRLRDGGLDASWQGVVARVSDTIDPATRTIGVIVEVEQPYANVQPGVRPPLFKGLFVEVELSGRPRADSLVIPRLALHGDQVYLLDGESRLALRTVTVARLQSEYAVIASGLDPGERVVVSDLIPAVQGMRLAGQPDPDLLARLTAIAGAVE